MWHSKKKKRREVGNAPTKTIWVSETHFFSDTPSITQYQATRVTDRAATVVIYGSLMQIRAAQGRRFWTDKAELSAWLLRYLEDRSQKHERELKALQWFIGNREQILERLALVKRHTPISAEERNQLRLSAASPEPPVSETPSDPA